MFYAEFVCFSVSKRRILFTTTDPINNRHIAKISMEGCRRARAIAAGSP